MNEIEKAKYIYENANILNAEVIRKEIKPIIEALEKQKSSGWIPVWVRTPSEEECSRFDILHPNRRKFYCTIKIGNYEPQVRELYFSTFRQWEYYSENYDKYVIAWQPLPEPFKEVENE